MNTRPYEHGRIFHPYTTGTQLYAAYGDRCKENNHTSSHGDRWEGSNHNTPIQQSQETDSWYSASDGKPDHTIGKDIPTNRIIKTRPTPSKSEIQTRSGCISYRLGSFSGFTHDRQKYNLPHYMVSFNILRVGTDKKQTNKIRVMKT